MNSRAFRRWISFTLLTVALAPAPAAALTDGWVLMWGSGGHTPELFDLPVGVDTDAAGNVYVVDRNSDRVQKFTNDGAFIKEWNLAATGAPNAIPYAVEVDGGFVYVADGAEDRIVKLTTSGAFVTQWGSHGSGDGQFDAPIGLAVDADHNVYVSDLENRRIEKFTSTGGFLTKWGSYGSGDGQMYTPRGIAIDAAGYVHVVGRYR